MKQHKILDVCYDDFHIVLFKNMELFREFDQVLFVNDRKVDVYVQKKNKNIKNTIVSCKLSNGHTITIENELMFGLPKQKIGMSVFLDDIKIYYKKDYFSIMEECEVLK